MLIKQDAQTIHTVVLDDCRNTIEEFVAVARYHAKVEFSQGYRDRVTASRKSLEATIASGVGVYGVNTGFGDNVRYRITEDEMVQLQENILRSHGCSVGRALSEEEARALMLMQLMSIGKGYSAVSLEMLEQIRTLDKKRLREKMGRVEDDIMQQVDAAIAVSFGLPHERLV